MIGEEEEEEEALGVARGLGNGFHVWGINIDVLNMTWYYGSIYKDV